MTGHAVFQIQDSSGHRRRYLSPAAFLTTLAGRASTPLRRGRFTDTWVFHQGSWVCVASQSTLIMK
jgi:hypothetical protein